MNIEKLAREAGFDAVEASVDGLVYEAESKHLKRFAASVAEECAKLCDSEHKRGKFNMENDTPQNFEFWNGGAIFADQLAEEIRHEFGATK